jgi:putative DNA primase/helicase
MTGETIERARGRWRQILPLLGVDPRFLSNKHGPCPACGGKDRFRFDDRDGSGSYFCNACGAGSGVVLVRKLHRWDFRTACDEIDRILGEIAHRPAPTRKATASPESCLARVRRALDGARDSTVVDRYLRSRGLSIIPRILRGDKNHPYFDESNRQLIGYFRAVLAPVVGPDGSLRATARIYSANAPSRKKFLGAVGNDPQVRLFDDFDTELGISEGIETAIACFELFSIPTWAALSDVGLANFKPPPGVHRVHIFGDRDASFAGQAATYVLAKRLKTIGLIAEDRLPDTVGFDWLDELNAKRMRSESSEPALSADHEREAVTTN